MIWFTYWRGNLSTFSIIDSKHSCRLKSDPYFAVSTQMDPSKIGHIALRIYIRNTTVTNHFKHVDVECSHKGKIVTNDCFWRVGRTQSLPELPTDCSRTLHVPPLPLHSARLPPLREIMKSRMREKYSRISVKVNHASMEIRYHYHLNFQL